MKTNRIFVLIKTCLLKPVIIILAVVTGSNRKDNITIVLQNGTSLKLPCQLAEKIYREVLENYRLEDAENHVEDMIENGSLERDVLESFGDMDDFYGDVVSCYEYHHDCNLPENDTYEAIINNLYQENKQLKSEEGKDGEF